MSSRRGASCSRDRRRSCSSTKTFGRRTSAASDEFRRLLFGGVLEDLFSLQPRHEDHERFQLGLPERTRSRILDAAAVVAGRLGISRRPRSLDAMTTSIVRLVETEGQLEHVYELFDDERSKQLFLELLRYRTLGPRHVRLRTNTRAYWAEHRSVDERFLLQRHTRTAYGWPLSLYEVPGCTAPIRLHAHHSNVLNTFVLDQYEYGDMVRVARGDVVVDGGGCWGDTALFFADRVGASGRVHVFEFVAENLEILRENLELNAELAERVVVHERALWDSGDETIPFKVRGPATSLAHGKPGANTATTATIDDLDEPIDFIKLDIEGAERRALEGATNTIAARGSKLAVAAYHTDDDFVGIPGRVKELLPSYRLFLDHVTVHAEETVLLATAGSRGGD